MLRYECKIQYRQIDVFAVGQWHFDILFKLGFEASFFF